MKILTCMKLFHFLLISETIQKIKIDYVIFRLFILNESTQTLPFRRNSEILISAHKSLLINSR